MDATAFPALSVWRPLFHQKVHGNALSVVPLYISNHNSQGQWAMLQLRRAQQLLLADTGITGRFPAYFASVDIANRFGLDDGHRQ